MMMMMINSTEAKLIKAKTRLRQDHPFWASLLARLPLREDNQATPTLATNGREIVYNSDFVDKSTYDETVFWLAHETDHAASNHCLRLRGRDHQTANEAADYVVNSRLARAGLVVPPGALYDSKYDNLAFEQAYARLTNERKQPNYRPIPRGNQPGDLREPTNQAGMPIDESEAQQMQTDNLVAIRQAAKMANQAGKLPGFLKEEVRLLRKPADQWFTRLLEFCSQASQRDYSWLHPDPVYQQADIIMPSLHSDSAGDVIFILDVSGSVDIDLAARMLDCGQEVLDTIQPSSLRVIQVDTEVQSDVEYMPGDVVDRVVHGRGGTMFQPAFDYIDQRGYMPTCVVYLTDLGSGDIPRDPGYPVLWIAYGCSRYQRGAFGETIHVLD